jgi:hypothetical protein
MRPLLGALAIVVAAVACSGCAEEESRFPVVVSTVTDDGKPLPGLAVTVGRAAAGKTDAEGRLRVRVRGKEGARVAIAVELPKGYRAAAPDGAVVLRRLTNIEGSGSRPLPVEHVVRFTPLTRAYAVMVRAGVPGLPVEIFGSQKALTNDKGVALFLYEGAPGDELAVKLVTDGRPELRPQNPTQSFLLAPRSEAYLFKEHFTVVPTKKEHKHHAPPPIVPKRL